MSPVHFPAPLGVAVGAALVVGYVILINPIGYFIATPLFLFLMPASLGYRNWGRLAGLSLAGTVFSCFVFYKILGVPLPMGILESLGGGGW